MPSLTFKNSNFKLHIYPLSHLLSLILPLSRTVRIFLIAASRTYILYFRWTVPRIACIVVYISRAGNKEESSLED